MKKTLLLFTTYLCLGLFSAFAQNVNIPDVNFKAYLVGDTALNTNNDSEISVAEAQAFTGALDVSNLSIADLTGIEAFINITGLDCYSNNLTAIDVSSNLALTRLHCADNSITYLDISLNTQIDEILCYNNQLTNLNIANGKGAAFTYMKSYNNPNLSCIQVDAGTAPPANVGVYDVGWTRDLETRVVEDCSTSITYVTIPDANFKSYLVGNSTINIDYDQEISVEEAQAVTGALDVSSLSISDLTGIEAFINLTALDCSDNTISALDVSTITGLTNLNCKENNIGSLNVQGTSLITLDAEDNSLTSLDVSNLATLTTLNTRSNSISNLNLQGANALEVLDCSDNSLTTLNVSLNTNLIDLNCSDNNLTTVDVTNLTTLTDLNISDNAISSIVLTANSNLNTLIASDNNFASIDVSNNTLLTELIVASNSLTSIDITNNTMLTAVDFQDNSISNLDISNNPNLTRIHAAFNQFTTFDISAYPQINQLLIYDNQLTSLNVANGNNSNFVYMKVYNNPDLTCVQIDSGYTPNQVGVYDNGWTKDATTNYSENCIPTVYYVNANATGNNDGSSWADAFTTINDALSNVLLNDEIWVSSGVYTPATAATVLRLDFENLKIYGGFDGTELTLADRDLTKVFTDNATIISGDINGDDIEGDFTTHKTDNATTLVSLEADNVIFDGFVLQNAYTSGSSPVIAANTDVTNFTLRNTWIAENYSNGLLLDWRDFSGDLVVENVAITNNATNNGVVLVEHSASNSDELTSHWSNILFTDNTYNSDFGAIWFRRGSSSNGNRSIVHYLNNATIVNNVNNHASVGHVINVSGSGWIRLETRNSIFWQNKYNGNQFSTVDIENSKTSEGDSQTINVYNAVAQVTSAATSGTYNESNLTILDPSTDNVNLDAAYKPTTASNYIIDQGDNTYYDTAIFASLDLSGNDRFFNSTIDLGAYEYNSTLGIDDVSLNTNAVKLYPNPVTDTLHIQSTAQIESVTIYTINGQLVKQSQGIDNGINVSNLPAGLYLIQMQTATKTVNQKFLKN
ncbi:T9SS type A sorting domain-containing protein [Winogradskyella sediminis]|uniref:Por secretion system C-terminal sorting domain-containing protein n=1 Tax=Winogradskyella sediminis TaxID=1382466 RepID=A0A1H1W8Q1_9FLAO|nr:T9SS type A sorting domain-containing protein [Winogradskyella sediminis]SDS92816.1 Por secretion system C-terminal sorting domain-containing protein [Winogradskyella sediminis]